MQNILCHEAINMLKISSSHCESWFYHRNWQPIISKAVFQHECCRYLLGFKLRLLSIIPDTSLSVDNNHLWQFKKRKIKSSPSNVKSNVSLGYNGFLLPWTEFPQVLMAANFSAASMFAKFCGNTLLSSTSFTTFEQAILIIIDSFPSLQLFLMICLLNCC